MSALDAWREAARARIPRGFLRRDRGGGLFVSDYPRYPGGGNVTLALQRAGFRVRVDGPLAYLNLAPAQIEEKAAACPIESPAPTDEALFPWALANRLIRNGGPVAEDDMPFVCLTLKRLDAGDLNALAKALSPLSALRQRQRRPLPAAIGRLILADLCRNSGSLSADYAAGKQTKA